jgi:hypothetical protein
MKKVNCDIRIVLEKVLASTDIERGVSPSIANDLLNELSLVSQRVRQLPLKNISLGSPHSSSGRPNPERITECKE